MKYTHNKGIVKKDKKGHPKLWLVFFIGIIIFVYAGVLFTSVALNGWPIESIDQTAKTVKSSRPKSGKDVLYIPVLNVTSSIGSDSLQKKGNPAASNVTIKGKKLGFGLTPRSIRQASPFYNLKNLKEGDEVYLDSQGVRYVYRITSGSSDDENILILQSENTKLLATPIGTVTWNGKSAVIKTF